MKLLKYLKQSAGNGTLRILIILLISLVLCFITVEVCAKFAEKKLVETADTSVKMNGRYIQTLISTSIYNSELFCKSFSSSLATLENDSTFHYLEGDMNQLSQNELFEMLESYLSLAKNIPGAGFYFKEGVIKGDSNKGTAVIVHGKERKRRDAIKEINISVDTLLSMLTQKQPYWTTLENGGFENFDCCYIVPFINKNSEIIGAFVTLSNLSSMSNILDFIKPFTYTKLAIVNNQEKIIAANQKSWNNKNIYDVILQHYGNGDNTDEINNFISVIKTGNATSTDVAVGGESWRVYVTPVTGYDYKMLMFLDSNRMLGYLKNIKGLMLLITLCGMSLIFVCLMYSFHSYKTTSDNKLLIDKELKIASEIQKSFLPKEMINNDKVEVAGFQKSAMSVGGDLYDMLLEGNKLYFCIGDVAGKGVPACMMMSMICSHFRSAIHNTSDPSVVMRRINNAISRRNESMMFCTLFIGVMDIDTGEIEICNAGHDCPIVLGGNGSNFVEVSQNLPVGVMYEFEYNKEVFTLEKKHSLFLYSDGVPEAEKMNKELFGLERLRKVMMDISSPYSVNKINNAVLSSVRSFTKGAEQSDDITMLAIHRK